MSNTLSGQVLRHAPKCFSARAASLALVALLLGVAATDSRAGLTIAGSRVIYDESEGEATVQVSHTTGHTPALMQAWMDDGDPTSRPGQQDAPFMLTPAVALMPPGSAQTIRVLRMGELPADRETLLFFNVLEVPPKTAQAAGENTVRFATQARLKFFYRPRGLQPSAGKAADALRFALHGVADGGVAGAGVAGRTANVDALRLHIHNPTPYHITLNDVALRVSDADNAAVLARLDRQHEMSPMIAPQSDLDIVLKPLDEESSTTLAKMDTAQARVQYTVVNDLGGYNRKQARLE